MIDARDQQTLETIAAVSPTVMIAFSRGKDSIAAWQVMRESGLFERIIPYFMWIIPGLKFVEESLAYYEDYFKTEIIRIPHPQLINMLRTMVYQPGERLQTIEALKLPRLNDFTQDRLARRKAGVPESTFIAVGTRRDDTIWRRVAIARHGAINHKRRTFTPIAYMNKDALIDAVMRAGCGLPVDYDWFNCSFDGLQYKFIAPIREHAPEDYALIRRWFPLIDLDIARHDGFEKVFGAGDDGQKTEN